MPGLGASNVTRGWQFLTRKHVFSGHGMLFSWLPRKLSCPWYCCCLVDSGWTSAEHVALSISVSLLSSFYSALSQSVFLERYREDQHVTAQVLTLINREVQSSLMLHSFSNVVCPFSLFSSQGRVFLHSCSQLRTCLADH